MLHTILFLQSSYFDQDDVALPGFNKFFDKASKVAYSHAENLMQVFLLI